MRSTRGRLLLAFGLAVLALGPAASVRADCQPASSVEEALASTRIAFVGTVVAVPEGTPGASVRVEEAWIGVVPATVDVRGMGDAGFMEDDRYWTLGARYLVIPHPEGGVLRDDVCTATTLWRDELAALRPAGAGGPAGGPGASGVPGALVAVIAAAAVLTIVAGFAFRRRSSPPGTP